MSHIRLIFVGNDGKNNDSHDPTLLHHIISSPLFTEFNIETNRLGVSN